MKIAIPVEGGKLCAHFGHCEKFSIFDVDDAQKITDGGELDPPPHEPGVFPAWLAEKGVTYVISGGMGQRAQDIFESNNIKVIVGASGDDPAQIAADFVEGKLSAGSNVCDH